MVHDGDLHVAYIEDLWQTVSLHVRVSCRELVLTSSPMPAITRLKIHKIIMATFAQPVACKTLPNN